MRLFGTMALAALACAISAAHAQTPDLPVMAHAGGSSLDSAMELGLEALLLVVSAGFALMLSTGRERT